MKTIFFRLPVLVAFLAFFISSIPLSAPAQAGNWNVAVLNQILAGVHPGQKILQVGDMGILVNRLTAWRNQLAGIPSLDSAFSTLSPSWTGGNVFYSFSDSGTNAVPPNLQEAFLDGAAEWAMFANLHFFARTTQANYITVEVDSGLEGGQSEVGMVGGEQFLSISPNAWNRYMICHELGHALGLIHEQQRTNRDNFVIILTNNVASGQLPNFVLLPDSTNYGAYDFLSIMHYSRNALSVNSSLDTIEPLPAYSQFLNIMGVPGATALSVSDRAGMAQVYGAGPTLSSVVTNTQDSGPGSLRAALYFAFDHPGTHITFNIPTNDPGYANGVFTIEPTDELPWLVNATILDGSTQPTNASSNPSGPLIVINGAKVPVPSTFPNGLYFGGTNCTARSLVINGFPESGILITGTNTTGNTVAGCYLGIDASGTVAVTNGLPGLTIAEGASGNIIGGVTAAARNVISGSPFQGVFISDPGTKSNVVEGNYIGLNAAGTGPLSNTWAGIAIYGGAQSNIIGGTTAATRNVISGNGNQGITISEPGTDGNVIEGNYIGCDPTGTVSISNAWEAVEIFDSAQGNLIGGTVAGSANLLSGNGLQGIAIDNGSEGNFVYGNYIGLNAAGTAALGNGGAGVGIYGPAVSNIVGGTSLTMRNYIAGNKLQGVAIGQAGANGNIVQGNYIGVNVAGTAAISNTDSGVEIFSGPLDNLIGGTTPGARNLISGNGTSGVLIDSSDTTGNIVQGNYIGVNPAGTAAIPNSQAGVVLYNGPQNTLVGGITPGAGNLISGNAFQGIWVAYPGTSGNLIQGNYIGVNASGTAAISNGYAGIEIYSGAQSNLVGGAVAGAGNIISGNGNQGVLMDFPGTAYNTIQGNLIGVNVSGTAAISNRYSGIEIYSGASSNLVGGLTADVGNIISGNGADGILMDFSGTLGNLIQGNLIGVNASGAAAIPNAQAGVEIYNGPQANVIGGPLPGAGNVISGNVNQGVIIDYAGSDSNLVQGNYVGLNAAGSAAVPNGQTGIRIYNTPQNNLIGGIGGERNFISGNLGAGVVIDTGSSNNIVQGNSIGVNVAGASVPNQNQGVYLFGDAQSNLIGGVAIGAANIIANNLSDGVDLSDSGTIGNTIRGNSIFNNSGGSGLSLFNNANNSQSAPVLNSAVLTTLTTISGSLSSAHNATFRLDFYASPPPASQRQAKVYLGGTNASTGAGGTISFTNTFTTPVPIGQIITATATDAAGDTSSLSTGVTVTGTSTFNDGISDAWRIAHFGGNGKSTNSLSCATCDPDHDGLDNLDEFYADTDPNNAASGLRAGTVAVNGADINVSFSSVQGIVYRVEYRDQVAAGGWSLLADQILGTGGDMQITDPGAAALPARFYRVDVLP